MPSNGKIQKAFVVISILTVLITIWIFVILMLQFIIHPSETELTSNNFDTMLLKILEEEESEKEDGKIKTIFMLPQEYASDQQQQQQVIKVNIDIWKPGIFRLNRINDTMNIHVDAVEQHLEVIQNHREIQIVTDLNQCQTFEVTNYILNDNVIVWQVNLNTVQFLHVNGSQETSVFDSDIVDLLKIVNESILVWRSASNRIVITNLMDKNTHYSIPFDTKPKSVEIFHEVLLCVLGNENLTVCNMVTGDNHVIDVIADVILSPTLVIKLLNHSTPSILLELTPSGMSFVESSININVDTDNIDDMYIFTQGHHVVIFDGLRGIVHILGDVHSKQYLPLKNLQVKHVVDIGSNDYRVFLSSHSTVYIITMISGKVVDILTRSDLRQVTDITNSFIVKKCKDRNSFDCTVLPSGIANLTAKVIK